MNREEIIEKYASEYLLEKVAAKKGKKARGSFGEVLAGSLAGIPTASSLMGPVLGIPTGMIGGAIVGRYIPGAGPGALLGGLAGAGAASLYGMLRSGFKSPPTIKQFLKDAFSGKALMELNRNILIGTGLGLAGTALGGYLGHKYWGKKNK